VYRIRAQLWKSVFSRRIWTTGRGITLPPPPLRMPSVNRSSTLHVKSWFSSTCIFVASTKIMITKPCVVVANEIRPNHFSTGLQQLRTGSKRLFFVLCGIRRFSSACHRRHDNNNNWATFYIQKREPRTKSSPRL